jgi:Flp pilus assembly protein TadB
MATLGIGVLAILSGLVALGIFLGIASFAIPSVMGRRVIEDDGRQRIGSIAEAQVLSAMASDMGRMFDREKGDIDKLIIKSGYVFQTPEEYYARRILFAIVYALVAGAAGVVLNLGFIITAIIITVGLLYGFTYPARKVQRAIKNRRERIQDEMGFGLEQLVNLLNTGTSLSDALAQMKDFGLFGKICDTVSTGLQTSKPIDNIIKDVLNSVPAPGQLEEFLALVKQSQVGGQVQTNAMRTMARMLRQRLANRILEKGGQAKVKATLVNTMVIVMASLIIVGVPGLVLFMSIGFF